MKDNNNQVSFHIAVDDKEAIQAIPFNRNAWAAGDGGNGSGNRNYIHIEICYSKSGDIRFKKAEEIAAKAVASILKDFGWGIDRIKAHRDFANKNCPHRTDITAFKNMIENELGNNYNQKQSKFEFENGDYSGKKAKVTADILNVRGDRGINYNKIGNLKKGDIVKLQYCLNEWISIDGFKGNKGLGYVSTDYLELV